MLNAKYFGAGMNLQMTTDLVIFHRFNAEMEEQIIGRAQRNGRTSPLNVYYLLHENESNSINNNFKFEDQNDIHYMDWLDECNKIETMQKNVINKNNIIIEDDIDLNLKDFKIIN